MADRRLGFIIAFASLLLLGAVAAQFNPTVGHAIWNIRDASGASVDANANGIIDWSEGIRPPGIRGPQIALLGCRQLANLPASPVAPPPVTAVTIGPGPIGPGSQCIDGVCHLVLRVHLPGGLIDTALLTFYQSSVDGFWVVSGQNPAKAAATGIASENFDGRNGGAAFETIASFDNMQLTDDSASEQSPGQVSFSSINPAELWVCGS